MTRFRSSLAAALLCLLVLASTAAAEVVPAPARIARVSVGTTAEGRPSLLIPVYYPIEFAGRLVETRVRLFDPEGGTVQKWVLHERLSSGRRRAPEARRRFLFVHRLGLSTLPAGGLEGLRARVLVRGAADVEGDGSTDLHEVTEAEWRVPGVRADLCSSIPRLRVRPGRRVVVPLPACGRAVHWRLGSTALGRARIRHGHLVYRAPRRYRGSDRVRLVPHEIAAGKARSSAALLDASEAQIVVGTAAGAVVRALGDSVTAGFGYYSNGTPMTIGRLLGCRPPAKEYDDACSSNSLVTANTQKLVYAPDYGLSNNISWAAQWANEHGVTNYANLAVSGSEPADWAPKGALHKTTEEVEAEDPDYILMTIGANPLLSNMLFGLDNMGCAVESDIVGGYRECIEAAFAEVHLRENLKRLYEDLVVHTDATIYLMQYHLAVPSSALAYSATQIAEMGVLLNREIASVAAEVNPKRLQVVTPPHFNVGIDISPVYPSTFTCSRLGYTVDGPSVQTTATQDELEVLHPLSFCKGPEGGGPPWVISGDTGIHPSAAGYQQMASQVPAPAG